MHRDLSDLPWRHARGAAAVLLLGAALVGCARYHAKPLAAGKVAGDFGKRSFTDAGLRTFLETNQVSGEWPRQGWELESLTLAAFYFSPELDVARAQWGTARSGLRTAGQRPNPTWSASPQYNATTFTPSPWVAAFNLDIPIETAGKRGHRMAQAGHLSDAAKLKVGSIAWQVRGKLRRALVDFCAATEQQRLLAGQQAAQEENVKLLEGQLAAGAVSPTEVTRERIALDMTRLAAHDAKRQRAESRLAVAEAIGIPVGALDAIEISFAGLDRVPPGLDTPAARRQALLNRADVLAGLSEYAASEAALRLEVAKQYPDIHLNPGYEYDQGDNKWGVGLSLELPVLNQNQGPIAEAEARRAESAAKFNALQAHVVAEIEPKPAEYPCTTNSQHCLPVFGNRIKGLAVSQPNEVWVGDLTYVRTAMGFLFLALLTDKVSRKVVGYHCGDTLEAGGCLAALKQALAEMPAGATPIHHSDQGTQYCCHEYVNWVVAHGLSVSMTETDHCAENALAERVNGILKSEYGLGGEFKTKAGGRLAVDQAVHLYNTRRPHTALGYRTPQEAHSLAA